MESEHPADLHIDRAKKKLISNERQLAPLRAHLGSVTPAKAGVQQDHDHRLDSGFRRNDALTFIANQDWIRNTMVKHG